MPHCNYLLGFFSFTNISFCLSSSLHPEDFIFLYSLLLRKQLFAPCPPLHCLSLCRELSYPIPLPWNLLRWNTFLSLYENHPNDPWSFAHFFSKFYSIFLLTRWPKTHAVFKISTDSHNRLMGFSFFFSLPFLLFLPLPNIVLLAFLTSIEYWADIFTELFTMSPGSFLSDNR